MLWQKLLLFLPFLSGLLTPTRILLTGDVMLGRSVMTKAFSVGDFAYPFRQIDQFLREADLVFVNLESPVVEPCPQTNTGMIFCANPQMLAGLTLAGVDVVNLENNHILNCGQEGLAQTKHYLTREGINYVGWGEMSVKEVKGVKFGFLGFDFVSRQPSPKDFELVKQSKGLVDILIVGVHWGSEYQSRAGKGQKEIARQLVAAGADVISGHHPHWVQAMEYLDGPTSPDGLRGASKPVFYSLGNLVFDQMWSEKTRKGMLAELTYKGKVLSEVKTYKTYIGNWGQPEIVK